MSTLTLPHSGLTVVWQSYAHQRRYILSNFTGKEREDQLKQLDIDTEVVIERTNLNTIRIMQK